MKKFLSYRMVNLFLFLASVVGMAFALYLEHGLGFKPCPLCVFQRVGLIALGVWSLIAFLHHPKSMIGRRVYNVLGLISIAWSAGVAGRHVWLQNLPKDEVPSCGPGLNYMVEALPFKDVLSQVLTGSGECAEIDWSFLGLSLPVWSGLFFSVLLLITLWQIIRPNRA